MIWNYSATRPEEVDVKNHLGTKQRTINFHIEEISKTEDGNKFRYHSVELAPGIWDYSSIVSSLVRYKFSDDAMTAIINNYLADPDNEEYKSEMEEMQTWRKEAKELAQKCLTLTEEK